jgi:heme exporter protein A
MSDSTPLLHLSGITKRFEGIRAVSNVNLKVFPGDFLTIFGPNGAGKTTLLRIIASLTQPTVGHIDFLQDSVNHGKTQVGYVSHQSFLYNDLTGFENLEFYGNLYDFHEPRTRASEMLIKMGLEKVGQRLVREYSRGMKQRLTLARALLHSPSLLLLDEPYTGLDQHGSRLLTGVLRNVKEEGSTVILITHNLREGLELCSRAVIQHRGQLILEAFSDELEISHFENVYLQMVGD